MTKDEKISLKKYSITSQTELILLNNGMSINYIIYLTE